VARRGGIRRADYPSDEARSAPVKSRRRRSLNIKPRHWLGTCGLDDRSAALLLRCIVHVSLAIRRGHFARGGVRYVT